jgi:putative membrane protein
MKHRPLTTRQIDATDARSTTTEATGRKSDTVLGAILVGAVSVVLVPALARAQPAGDNYGAHMMWDGGWPGMVIGPLMMILFLAAMVAVAVLVVRWLGGAGHRSLPAATSAKTPLDILKERFARGEIDKAEYEERRRLIES